VLAVFDSVVDSIGLAELCLRWGDVDARLANLEALRSHAVNYVNSCVSAGTGCTAAGLVAYLVGLANDAVDGQGVDEDDHAVVVSTWHKAKGLEWPIVVLFPLYRRDPSTRALGLTVQTDQPRLTLSDPLAGRWIRFWPTPYSYGTRKSPFHDRLADHAATMAAMLQADREDLRLLYVGWTRARDRIVLTGRPDKLTNGLLQLLQDKDGPLVDDPDGSTLTWAGQTVKLVIRDAEPLSPETRKLKVGSGYVAAGAREHPPAFVLPSSVAGAALTLTEYERIGERVGVTGNDYASLGNAIHAFLCADRPGLKPGQRESLLGELLGRWSVTAVVDVREVLAASDGLRAWVANRWPDAKWHREWPVLWRTMEGSVIRGSTDLVLGVDGGLVVIDHKSFPGSVSQALARCGEYVGQLGSYTSAIETAMGRKVLSQWVHLPVSGIVVPLSDKVVASTNLVIDTVPIEAPLAHPTRRPTMQKIEVVLIKGKETKGTYVYEEELAEGGKPPVLKTQYIQKWALGSNPPERIMVTIEAV
jgi:ATP-dependent helicase/nuclease subunit A